MKTTLSLERLEDRSAPSAAYGGGPLLGNVQVNDVFLGQQRLPQVDAMMSYLASGPYAAVWAPFGPGPGSLHSSAAMPQAGCAGDLQIQLDLAFGILSGRLPAPDANSLYVVFLPPGRPGPLGTSYHGDLPWLFGEVPYAVVQTDSADPATYAAGASHELVESVTDPAPYSGWADRGGNEAADLSRDGFDLGGYFVASVIGPDGQTVTATPSSANGNGVRPGGMPGTDPAPALLWADLALFGLLAWTAAPGFAAQSQGASS